jgi:hypothetical protein
MPIPAIFVRSRLRNELRIILQIEKLTIFTTIGQKLLMIKWVKGNRKS